MSDESVVTFANDNGHKNRWGLEKWLYRNEGPKKSVNGKVLAALFGSFMVTGAGYSILSEFFKPTPSESNGPINFHEQIGEPEAIHVPLGNGETSRQPSRAKPRLKPQAPMVYGGLQVIERPNHGQIPSGTMVRAKFMTGASNGPLKAALMENLTVNGEVIAPAGSVLVGVGSSNEDRLMVQFSKLVFRDGKSQNIKGQACDVSDQTVGVKGKKLSKYAVLLASGAGLNFLGGLAEGLQEKEVQNGVVIKKSDLKNAALNGASKAALDQSSQLLAELKKSKSVIQVQSGKEFYVLFEGE